MADRRTFLKAIAATTLLATPRPSAAASDRVRVGFIGFGLIGKRHLLDFKAQPDVDLVAVADVSPTRVDEARARLGGRGDGVADFRRLLDDKDVDAVVVSTPDHWHALMTMHGLRRRQGRLRREAAHAVRARGPLDGRRRPRTHRARRAGRHAAALRARTTSGRGELIRGGHIGDVVTCACAPTATSCPASARRPTATPPPELDWDMFLGPAPLRPYNPNRGLYHFRWFWDYSGGQMTNLGHSLDIVHWIPGAMPRARVGVRRPASLQDNGETPDTQEALFEFPRFTGLVVAPRGVGGRLDRGLEFFGTKGTLVDRPRGLRVVPDADDPAGDQSRSSPARPPAVARAARRRRDRAVEGRRRRAGRDQFVPHVRNFLDCVKSRAAARLRPGSGAPDGDGLPPGQRRHAPRAAVRWDAGAGRGRRRSRRRRALLGKHTARRGTASCGRSCRPPGLKSGSTREAARSDHG